MVALHSKKFPNILYKPGEEIDYLPDDIGTSFIFDVDSDLTNDKGAMNRVALFLDDLDELKEKALFCIHSIIDDKLDPYHGIVFGFLDLHIYFICGEESISLHEAAGHLKLVRFSSWVSGELNEQIFAMFFGYGLGADLGGDVMIIYFDIYKNIFSILHED